MFGSLTRALLIASMGSAGVIGGIWLPMLWHQAMTDFGMALVPLIALFVSIQIALIIKLQDSPNTPLRYVGHALAMVTQYLALFEGLVFLVPVLWLTSLVFGYAAAPSYDTFMNELAVGTAYVSMLVYGGTGGAAILGADGRIKRLFATAYTAVVFAAPIIFLNSQYGQINVIGLDYPLAVISTGMGYLALASVLGMLMVSGLPRYKDFKPSRIAALRAARSRRLRS